MKVIDNIAELRSSLSQERCSNKKIGLVPTMGALHQGHISLITESQFQDDITVCSIFVNPAQFNSSDDLDKYPKQLESDLEMLKASGCDLVFVPSVDEMYPEEETVKMSFGRLEEVLEGSFRPGHFSGVGVVVAKLFNISQADSAYFGQKDMQQVAIIKKMVLDLNFNIAIKVVPTVRESTGLAMSSRNLRLSDNGRKLATQLFKGLSKVSSSILGGVAIHETLKNISITLNKVEGFDLEYLDVVDSLTMQKINRLEEAKEVSVCGAAFVDGVRIIDNIYIKQSF